MPYTVTDNIIKMNEEHIPYQQTASFSVISQRVDYIFELQEKSF